MIYSVGGLPWEEFGAMAIQYKHLHSLKTSGCVLQNMRRQCFMGIWVLVTEQNIGVGMVLFSNEKVCANPSPKTKREASGKHASNCWKCNRPTKLIESNKGGEEKSRKTLSHRDPLE